VRPLHGKDAKLSPLSREVVSKALIFNNFIEDLQLLIDLTDYYRPILNMVTGSVLTFLSKPDK
jgi:hypothetical protein